MLSMDWRVGDTGCGHGRCTSEPTRASSTVTLLSWYFLLVQWISLHRYIGAWIARSTNDIIISLPPTRMTRPFGPRALYFLCIVALLAVSLISSTEASIATTTTKSSLALESLTQQQPWKKQQNLHQLKHPLSTQNSLLRSSTFLSSRGGQVSESWATDLLKRLELSAYFALWYALNIVYNIVNKKVLNVLPAPLIIGTLQFGVGAIFCSLLWILRLRPAPTLTPNGHRAIRHIGAYHAAGQLASMISLGAGPVSFTHIVKALEPVFSALVSGIALHEWLPPQVYATLIPVIGGVGYACLKERYFSFKAFNAAMASNLAFAMRAVASKAAMTNPIGTNMSSANLFGLVTCMAFLMSIPFALLGEGWDSFITLWNTATQTTSPVELVQRVVLSGLFHYLNNEVMYLALSNVHPVTLAVGNTMKRVFIMVASVLVFRNPVSTQAGIGSAVGIGGVLLYSIVKAISERTPVVVVVPVDTIKPKHRPPSSPKKSSSTKAVVSTKKSPSSSSSASTNKKR